MKKISEKEFRKLEPVKRGQKSTDLSKALLALKDEEMLFIKKDEWELKSNPYDLLTSARYNPKSALYGIRLWVRTVKGGWVIGRRVKKNGV